MQQQLKYRLIKNAIFKVSIAFIAFLTAVPLLFILYYIVSKGIGVISWDFLFNLPKPSGEEAPGVANAIVGTFILIGLSCIIAVPISIFVGIFLSESKGSSMTYWVRLCVEILQGIPSIVIGIIAYLWIVEPMGGFSAISGGIALGIMMIPFVVRSTEETLKLIPSSYREASLALGVPYYKTILKVIVPSGMGGIVTGTMISVARIAGETAPLLFTAFGSPYLNLNINDPVHALPLLIFKYATSPYDDWLALAWGASFVLIVFILLMNLMAKLVVKRWEIQF